ncbi:MAG: hypothetical protein F9K18_08940 [Thermoanaerobaculia bacterium]|nr:MAG: hypothetical protein F9K18_08940 [Thermoanaerobaculia bacterium]
MLHTVASAPVSSLPPERRGRPVGLFCRGCQSVYPLLSRRHAGKPEHGRDHVASPCSYEGRAFAPGAGWWEPAVEVLPAAPAPAVAG